MQIYGKAREVIDLIIRDENIDLDRLEWEKIGRFGIAEIEADEYPQDWGWTQDGYPAQQRSSI